MRHLKDGYAQGHPAEDFAETFAVWLDPQSNWKKKYQNWGCLKKLLYMDQLMHSLQGAKPVQYDKNVYYEIHSMDKTYGKYLWERKQKFNSKDTFWDNLKLGVKGLSKTNKKIKLLRHKKNLGKGAAVINGLKKVSSDYLLIQDADLEYNPDEYIKLVSKVSADTVVYGSRMIKKNTHAYERTYIGNLVLTYICNFLFGTKLTDSYTCYKLLPTKIAKKLNLKSQGFELEAEITAKLAKKKINIFEVPISYSPRKYEEGKKIKALDALKGVFTLLRIKFTNY